jgi:hypothetical protein
VHVGPEKQLTWSQELADPCHYRDHNKVKVGAVLENRQRQVIGISRQSGRNSTSAPPGTHEHAAQAVLAASGSRAVFQRHDLIAAAWKC